MWQNVIYLPFFDNFTASPEDMLFNSIEFAIFLPCVFVVYWFVVNRNLQLQNAFLLAASYLFYGWWDWRFLSLIVFSSTVDYLVGLQLGKEERLKKRKLLLVVSLLTNLGFLGFFKYYNFFAESFIDAFTLMGSNFSAERLDIILPVGISFYTFQTLSYTIDVYNRKLEPTRSALDFFAFVSFFPQLVAGPIERATALLPQFYVKRVFNYSLAISGMRLIVWGLFKKMVIADNAAMIVDGIFTGYEGQSSLSLVVGMLLFAFQIYCDFSGYSDIAIGTARLFGFELMTNFRFPYLAKDISEFWKRWHISLSTWFRDYVYIPLGGSRVGRWHALRNIFVVFIVSGFWHGANWTFLAWGFIHAALYLPVFFGSGSKPVEFNGFSVKNTMNILITFVLVCFAWVFFRAPSVTDAVMYIVRMFDPQGSGSYFMQSSKYLLITSMAVIGIMALLVIEVANNRMNRKEINLPNYGLVMAVLAIAFMGALKNHASFIYFQF